jgi:lon-related putative ATP-dependent protease
LKDLKDQEDKSLQELQREAKAKQMYLVALHGGFVFVPGDSNGELYDEKRINEMPQEEKERLEKVMVIFNEKLAEILNQFPILERQTRDKVRFLIKEIISLTVKPLINMVENKYAEINGVGLYLEEVFQDIISNSKDFKRSFDINKTQEKKTIFNVGETADSLRRFEVNVLIDNGELNGGPVIYEDNPSFSNLVGQVEHLSQLGILITDFMLIKSGSLHRANGGYLILDANKLLSSPYSWEALKRNLRAHKISIESMGKVLGLISTLSLEPEPIPLDLKIVLFGDRNLFYLLSRFDSEFLDLFKVSADFGSDMPRTIENENLYLRHLKFISDKNQLLPLNGMGAARMIEFSSYVADDGEKLSSDFEQSLDLIREVQLLVKNENRTIINASDIQKTLDARRNRSNRIYERLIEESLRGNILLQFDGEAVGQINGIAVIDIGNSVFGHPTKITAGVRMGNGDVVDIEREVHLGGPIHSKGVFILAGYLKSHYALDVPFSVSATLVFEQSYYGIEGDSASLAELAVLLSALGNIPIKQSIGVTGSINQHGQVQPVGGINQKIEGYYDFCVSQNLTGNQGVIIPKSNIKNLMLKRELLDSVKEGKFRIFSVEDINDCMVILSGWQIEKINEKIESRLKEFSKKKSEFKNSNQ